MVTKNKDDWVNIRIPTDMKAQILEMVEAGDYDNMADLIREAITEKLDPRKRKEITEKQFAEMLVKTLQSNPSILAEQLKDIGLQFVLRE
jgi:Arc/MetJ-type ribon-helix-helix transcriptional regulator